MAEIDEEELAEFNLTVLRRIDPQIESILFSGGHVSVYEFDQKTQKWDHKEVKGPLFLLKRDSVDAKYVFIVLNRLQIKTLAEQFTPKMSFENTSKYLLYQTEVDGVKSISGIWFFDSQLKDEFYHLVARILEELSSGIDLVKEEEEEAPTLAPSVANIFRLASAPPAPQPRYPVPTPQAPIANPFGNVKIDVASLFGQTPPPKPAAPNGLQISVNDLFQKPTVMPSAPSAAPNPMLLPIPRFPSAPQVMPQASPQTLRPNPSQVPPTMSSQDFMRLLQGAQQQSPAVVLPQRAGPPHVNGQLASPIPSPFKPPIQIQPSVVQPPPNADASRKWFPDLDAMMASQPSTTQAQVTGPAIPLNKSASSPPPGYTPESSPALSRNRVINEPPTALMAQPKPSAPTKPVPDLTQLLLKNKVKPERKPEPKVAKPPVAAPVAAAVPPQVPAAALSPAPAPPVAATAAQQLSKDQLRAAIIQLLQNDSFIDAIYGAYASSVTQSGKR